MSNEFFLPFKDTTRKRTSLYAVQITKYILKKQEYCTEAGRNKEQGKSDSERNKEL